MRKINLENYMLEARNEKNEIVNMPYDVKGSLIGVLFHPELKLSGRELLLRDKLANKINDTESEILLEETDYSKVKLAVESINGYTRNDVEFVRRVLEAEEIEVKEK